MENRFLVPVTALAVLALAACGGGGGGPNTAMTGGGNTGNTPEPANGPSVEQPGAAASPNYAVTGQGSNARITGLTYSTTEGVADRTHVGDYFAEYDGFVFHLLQSSPRPDNPEWFDVNIDTVSVFDGILSWGIWSGPSFDSDLLNPGETAFHRGPSYDASSLARLSGTATYRGLARAHAEYGENNYADYSFVGEATLTADFDAELLSGSISDRRVNEFAGNTEGNWNIQLGAVPLAAGSAEFSSSESAVTATFVPGVNPPYGLTSTVTANGSWNGSFRGTEPDGSPSGITGTFQADSGSQGVAISGSFGATKGQ